MFWWNRLNKNRVWPILVISLASLWAIWPLFRPGFFQSDDGEWMIIRFSAFHQALVDGQFPVRWLGRLNHEYGYPVANFLYPGFMYLAEIPKILGFGFVNSIKIIIGLSMVGSAVFTFFWLKKLFDDLSAFTGALFYLYTPYHLYDLYKRGSVGEILALTVVPFIFWQLERRSIFFTSVGVAFLILSHNALALISLPIVVTYMGFTIFKNREVRQLIYQYTSILVLGLALSAFFWVPAIFDLQYTKFFQTQVSQWQDYFVELNLIGIASIVVMAIALLVFLKKKKKDNRTVLFLIFGLISVFMSLPVSSSLWQILPVSFVQFPFRFLSILILSTAFLTAFLVNELKGNKRLVTIGILILLLGFSAIPYLKPTVVFDKGDPYYATNEDSTTVKNEYMPKWVKIKPTERFKQKVEITEGKANISNLIYNSKKVEFNIESLSDSKVRINTIYFPGWKAFIDSKESPISFNNDKGVMEINVPKGEHDIKSVFSETPSRLISNLISLAGLIGLVVLTVKDNRLNLLQIYQYIFSRWGLRGKR